MVSHCAGDAGVLGRRAAVSAASVGRAMTTFPNAAPPPGALYDNVPTVPQVAQEYAAAFGVSVEHARMLVDGVTLTPTHLTPATRISQIKGGQWVALDVLMQYGKPVPLELALRRVAIGRTVFVARGDAAAVMESLHGVASDLASLTDA